MNGIETHARYVLDAHERAVQGNKPLIHSLSEAREFVFDLIEALGVRSVCEVGSEGGLMSRALFERYQAGLLDRLTVIDPIPTAEVSSFADGKGCHVLADVSLSALSDLPHHDLYILDGDHNFYTVYHELKHILRHKDVCVLMHDVAWPWARRDLYYNPAAIPFEEMHPKVERGGLRPGFDAIQETGFDSEGNYSIAVSEGFPSNGVFTAVEAVAAEIPLEFSSLPALFGIGLVRGKNHPMEESIRTKFDLGGLDALLWRLEENRLEGFNARKAFEKQVAILHAENERLRRLLPTSWPILGTVISFVKSVLKNFGARL